MSQKAWCSFTSARTFAHSLKLKNSTAWKAWWKKHDRPADIPSEPSQFKAYAEDWAGWEDFLGDSYVNTKKKAWRSFTAVRTVARSLKLKSCRAWHAWWKEHDRPADIPREPNKCKAYAEDWAGWEEFLGDSYVNSVVKMNNKTKKAWRSFTVARTFARSLKLKNSTAWEAWWKEHDRPADIPSAPAQCKAYAADWAGWEDFLGDSYVNVHKEKAWRSFDEVRAYAQSLNLRNASAWKAWWKKHDRPADIPSVPDQVYAEDWAGWEDFLGDYIYVNTKKTTKKTTRKKELGKRKRAGVRKRASTSESAAKKRRKKKRKTKQQHHHRQRMETTRTVEEGEGMQRSSKPFARV